MTEVQKIYVLDPKQLAAVRQRAGANLSVNSNTTSLEAGMQIGIARVIHILQEGFTVEAQAPTSRDG